MPYLRLKGELQVGTEELCWELYGGLAATSSRPFLRMAPEEGEDGEVTLVDTEQLIASDCLDLGPLGPLPAPSGLTATSSSTLGLITLAWVDRSSNETGFEVQLRRSGEDWERLGRVAETIFLEAEGNYSVEKFIGALQGCTGLIKLGGRLPELSREIFAAVPHLRIAGIRGDRFGRGIDLEAAAHFGVKVVDTDNIASSQPVADCGVAKYSIIARTSGRSLNIAMMSPATRNGLPYCSSIGGR